MSFQGLQERLAALQDTTSQLRDLIDRLSTLRFQPGSVPLDASEEESVSGELSVEITQLLREAEEDAELLGEEVLYLRPEGDEQRGLREGVERVEGELKSHRLAFRKARLSAKKNLAQAQRLERELVLQSYSQPPSDPVSPTAEETDDTNTNGHAQPEYTSIRQQHRSHLHQHQQVSALSEEDKHTVGASTNVTNALRRTHDLIQSELERSEFARQTLEESSAALKGLTESYGSLDDMLTSTKKLLGTLVSSQKSDTWYLQTTFYLLCVTAAWLVFRRFLYGPIALFVLWPLRILFGVGNTAVSVTKGLGGDKSGKGGVGEDKKVSVDGIPGEELPTAKVGNDHVVDGRDEEKDPVREQVERIIEKANEAEELGSIPGEERGEQPVGEQPVGEREVRDEL